MEDTTTQRCKPVSRWESKSGEGKIVKSLMVTNNTQHRKCDIHTLKDWFEELNYSVATLSFVYTLMYKSQIS